MEIKTKFEIGDLLERKYTNKNKEKSFALWEVLEIVSNTCYAATQVFYFCRVLSAKKEKVYGESELKYQWEVNHGISNDDNGMGWQKLREDELIEATQECKDILLSNQ